jgi:HEAT repeat protein
MFPAAFLLPLLLSQSAADADALIDRLRTEDPAERRRVLAELSQRGAEAVPAMVRALDRVSPKPEEEVDRLVKQLASASWKERTQATEALVRLGRPALPVLEARIAAADPEAAWRLRSAAAEIRDKAGQDEQLEEVRAAAICDALGQAGDGRAAPALLRLLGADGPAKRPQLKLRAAQALGLLRGTMSAAQSEEATDRVLQILEQTSAPLDKAMLLKALGRLGAATSVRPIAALLADRSEKNVHLKRSCMSALASIGQARGVRAIVESLDADDVYVRQGAASVLEELSGAPFGFDPRAAAEDNREAVARIKSWGASKYGEAWNQ